MNLRMHRFENSELEDVVEEFNKLRLEGTLEDYQRVFENLKVRMERLIPN